MKNEGRTSYPMGKADVFSKPKEDLVKLFATDHTEFLNSR
jgi:hypothetical protein